MMIIRKAEIAVKVLLINGSPHEKGATFTALDTVRRALCDCGVEGEIFWLGNSPIGGCMGCGYCRKAGTCIRGDAVSLVAERLEGFDGFVFGSAVHYAAATGALSSFMDRLFYSSAGKLRFKPAAAVVSCRRGGAVTAFDEINKYFTINEMPVVSSSYWNLIHGRSAEEALADEEGIRTMYRLGRNMAYILKCMRIAAESGIVPPEN